VGYNTNFSGVLNIGSGDPTVNQIVELKKYLGEDRRKHPEWSEGFVGWKPEWYGIDLKLTEDMLGIKWNGAEKSYDMVGQVNFVIDKMREKWPDFTLNGTFKCSGDDPGDIWILSCDADGARHVGVPMPGKNIQCPHCKKHFELPEMIE